MEEKFQGMIGAIRGVAAGGRFKAHVSEEGKILSVGDGIAQVTGLRDAKLNELLKLGRESSGIVFDLYADRIGVVILSGGDGLKAGESAWRTGRIASVDVGESILGRVVDALGIPIDDGPELTGLSHCAVDRIAPPLLAREYVTEPLDTGIIVIDAMLSIGRGQRELIIGDPATGKTSLALDAILNQKNTDVISVYVSIGQNRARVLKIIDEIKKYGDLNRTIVVSADAADSVGLQYLVPYSATAIAEYFLDRGRDVLIVYDDLSKHADAYRSLSLLLKRPPGREAYPGDIFFIHARLLERAARLHRSYGGGSITALPIIETQQGRIASYIPTNLISITDGQIFLDSALFNKGIRPAVDVARSVSRIGGKAQTEAMKGVAEKLKIDYSRFLEVEVFSRFGTRVEDETAKLIRRGERMREILKQHCFHPVASEDQVLTLLVLEMGLVDSCETASVASRCNEILAEIKTAFPAIVSRLRNEGRIGEQDMAGLAEFFLKP